MGVSFNKATSSCFAAAVVTYIPCLAPPRRRICSTNASLAAGCWLQREKATRRWPRLLPQLFDCVVTSSLHTTVVTRSIIGFDLVS
jgi:hypothetical protein